MAAGGPRSFRPFRTFISLLPKTMGFRPWLPPFATIVASPSIAIFTKGALDDTPNGYYFVISGIESISNFEQGISKAEGIRTLLRYSVFCIRYSTFNANQWHQRYPADLFVFPTRAMVVSTELNRALALLTVSWYSLFGSLSATKPAPAWI